MKEVLYLDLGRMGYRECWDKQRTMFDSMLLAKRAGAQEGEPVAGKSTEVGDAGVLYLVEHNPVYTLGKSGKSENMLVSEPYLRSIGAEFFHIDRGGDVTYHGPGQVVGYPILDLEKLGIGLREYIDKLEEAIIGVCAEWGIQAGRIAGASGVWLDADTARARKICAIGVRASRYVTMHGFAMNVNTDLKYFNHINPCGFVDKGVTSLEKELGHEVDMELVKAQIVKHLAEKLKIEIYK
ncbi:MAG: lipoyl(octanoyl) transferase LipB [Alistipes sp.]|nr:lipoyl(octanoyl) transferase LipB [Alistipes sp.]